MFIFNWWIQCRIYSNLESNEIKPEDESYLKCYEEAIKSHHNQKLNYIYDNYLISNFNHDESYLIPFTKYFNFSFDSNININSYIFYRQLCYLKR